MKFFAAAILFSCSTFAADLSSNFNAAFLQDLPAPTQVAVELPDESVAVVGPQVPLVEPPPPIFPKDTRALIRSAARKNQVPTAFVKSIVAAESNFNPGALSPKGAIGLMQLMPTTAQQFGADPTNPEQNLDAGAHYLRVLMDRYYRKSRDWLRRVIAAYNAGPGAVDRYRGVPPYHETQVYVARVLQFLRQFQRER